MPFVVFTLVFTLAETSMLSWKLPALDLEVADAMQDELEDIPHGGVVDRTRVALDDTTEDLLLAPGVVDGGASLSLEVHDLLHDSRSLAQGLDELPVDLVYPLPELPDSLLYLGIRHRIRNCISAGIRLQASGYRLQETVGSRNRSDVHPCCKARERGLVFSD